MILKLCNVIVNSNKKLEVISVIRYEQLTIDMLLGVKQPNVQKDESCFDSNGNQIKIGDYVTAVSGEARENGIEGIVKEIFFYEESGPKIKISTYCGRILGMYEDPLCYVVI